MTTPVPVDGLDPLLAEVDGRRMAATVATLAGVPFAGRRVGTPGGAAARAWLGQQLADLDATVDFAAFPVTAVALLDGEETGALGSAQHAAQLRRDGVAPLVINVDGAGHLRPAAAVEAGGPAHALLAALDQAGRHTGLPLVAGPVASDNRRYAAAGLATVGIGAGMAGYHSPADTPDRVDTATMTALARLVVANGWLAARTPAKVSSSIGDRR